MCDQSICDEWSLAGLADHFKKVHHEMQDHKFAWVLGAGASHSSKIPLGSDLVDQWLRELATQHGVAGRKGGLSEQDIKSWVKSDGFKALGIKKPGSRKSKFKWKNRSEFYTQIYDTRYRHHPDEGFATLERLMADKDPSPGYSILASILAMKPPRHNAVVTTNFDNLVADALSIYTDAFPFVCGHESLTAFVRVAMRRPLICKIHRDLLLGPQNDTRSLRRLHDAWGAALRSLFEHYTPLFIGYGGNDDTLMDLLESFESDDIKGRPIWCYFARDPYDPKHKRPSQRIQELMAHHHGVIVPVPDFDLLMILLGERIGINLLDERILKRAKQRQNQYRKHVTDIDTVKHPIVAKALYSYFERTGKWWAWEQKALKVTDSDERKVLYKQALDQYPESHELLGNFASFLTKVRGEHDEAEKLFRRAIEADPDGATSHGNYASFLTRVRGEHDEAEKLFRCAIEFDPKHVNNLGNFANFLTDVRGEYDDAEDLYLRGIDADPKRANILGNYATFLTEVRGEHDEAEKLYRRAVEADPKHANQLGNFAYFLTQVRGEHDEAEKLFRRAIEAEPNNAHQHCNFSEFLLSQGKLQDATEMADSAWCLSHERSDGIATITSWLDAIIRLLSGESDGQARRRLRDRLHREEWCIGWQCDEPTAQYLRDNLPLRAAL